MANKYFTCEIHGWREDRVFKAEMRYYRQDGLTYTYGDTSFPDPSMDMGAGVVYYDSTLGAQVRGQSCRIGSYTSPTYSRTVAGEGNRTATWTAGSGLRSDFAGTWSTTIYFPSPYSAPAQPSVSIAERYTNGAKFNVSLSSYGNPSGESGRYIEAAILAQNSYGATYKYQIAQNTSSAAITVNNNTNRGTLVIKSNTQYWYGGYATNNHLNNSRIAGQFYTLPTAPVGTAFTSTGTDTAQFKITDSSEGSGQLIQLQYRYKEHSASSYGSWTNAGSTGNKQTRTVNLADLTPGVAYDIQVRAKAGSSDYSAENTYLSAFTTDRVGVSVTDFSYSFVEASDDRECRTVIDYIVSASGSVSNCDISYSLVEDGVPYGDYTESNVPISGTLTLPLLKKGSSYTLTIKARPANETTWGDTSTYNFITPTFEPTAPTIANLIWRSKNGSSLSSGGWYRTGISFDIYAAPEGPGETSHSLSVREEWYDIAEDRWIQGEVQTIGDVARWTTSINTKYEPDRVSKRALVAWQTSNLGIDSPVSRVVFTNRPLGLGIVTPPDGNRQLIVGVRTKTSDGVLHPSDYSEPFNVIT